MPEISKSIDYSRHSNWRWKVHYEISNARRKEDGIFEEFAMVYTRQTKRERLAYLEISAQKESML